MEEGKAGKVGNEVKEGQVVADIQDAKEAVTETVASSAPEPELADSLSEAESDRNPVFEQLVAGDADIVGLVAYSIYKQNKRDWLIAFRRVKVRAPTEDESSAYIIGESTPRRLATFRHLAQATLDGRGPDVAMGFENGQSLGPDGLPRSYPIAQRPQSMGAARDIIGNNLIASFVALGIVAVGAAYLLLRFGIPTISH
jgi:hypothetical protein